MRLLSRATFGVLPWRKAEEFLEIRGQASPLASCLVTVGRKASWQSRSSNLRGNCTVSLSTEPIQEMYLRAVYVQQAWNN